MPWNATHLSDHPALAALRAGWLTRAELAEALSMHLTSAGVLLRLAWVHLEGTRADSPEVLVARPRKQGSLRGAIPWEFRVVPRAEVPPDAVPAAGVLRV